MFEKGGNTTAAGIPNTNCARSIAVAHNRMAIKGMAVHMTEVGQVGLNPYIVTDGWSQDVSACIYTFCKVNEHGEPSDDAGGALPWVHCETIRGSRSASSSQQLPAPRNPSGAFCRCIELEEGVPVGCREAIAVTITPTNNNFVTPTSGTVSNVQGYSPTARSISVTLYLETDDQDGIIFSGS
jgi:hypothetical protein